MKRSVYVRKPTQKGKTMIVFVRVQDWVSSQLHPPEENPGAELGDQPDFDPLE